MTVDVAATAAVKGLSLVCAVVHASVRLCGYKYLILETLRFGGYSVDWSLVYRGCKYRLAFISMRLSRSI